jgi:hypothetical protein
MTPKRGVALIGGLLAVVSFARVSVLFLEALSSVRAERFQDVELLELCVSGAARGSSKMRIACLQAQSDRASPVVLKAVLRAVSTAFADFSDSVSSPSKLVVVLLFTLCSVFLPLRGWIQALLPGEEAMDSRSHVVVMANEHAQLRGFRNVLNRRLLTARHVQMPMDSLETGSDIEDAVVDIDLVGHHKWE